MNVSPYRVAYVTCSSQKEAQHLAQTVVEKSLAACVNILGPMTSVYIWEGTCQQEAEWLLMIKTEQSKVSALEACITRLHTYTVPEFIVLPILEGSKPYLDWISKSLCHTS